MVQSSKVPVKDLASGESSTHIREAIPRTVTPPQHSWAEAGCWHTTLDPSGYGAGQRWLGSRSVTTNESGNVSFNVELTEAVRPGEFITATATDPALNTSEFSAPNRAPTANAGGPYAVDVGGSITLDGSRSTDPDQPAATLVYEWDLDGDGVFGETGDNALRGDERGLTPTFFAAGLAGPVTVGRGGGKGDILNTVRPDIC